MGLLRQTNKVGEDADSIAADLHLTKHYISGMEGRSDGVQVPLVARASQDRFGLDPP